MAEKEIRFLRQFVRYGVPAVILLFYLAALRRFEYTPDSTFQSLLSVRDSENSSLWILFLALAKLLRLDLLMAAKLFSLVFSSFAILFTYLITHEVLQDHLLAFCAALSVSMQAWLLQLAASGSGLGCLLFVSLAAVFFMLRNEYVISAVFAALASLVAWQAAGLLAVLVLDAYVNSTEKTHGLKLGASLVMVFAGVVLPWVLYAVYSGHPLVPNELDASDLPAITPQMSFEIVLLVGTMFVGIVLLATRDREMLRSYTALVLWIVMASFGHQRMFALSLPLIIVFAFSAVRKIMQVLGASNFGHVAAVVFAAALLAYAQFVTQPAAKTVMDNEIAVDTELRPIGQWLRAHAGAEDAIAAPEHHAGIIQYYSESRIVADNPSIVISNLTAMPGSQVLYDPSVYTPLLLENPAHYKIWRVK